jgi:hypothetical protein
LVFEVVFVIKTHAFLSVSVCILGEFKTDERQIERDGRNHPTELCHNNVSHVVLSTQADRGERREGSLSLEVRTVITLSVALQTHWTEELFNMGTMYSGILHCFEKLLRTKTDRSPDFQHC